MFTLWRMTVRSAQLSRIVQDLDAQSIQNAQFMNIN